MARVDTEEWGQRELRICVLRNHAFEPLMPACEVFLRYAGLAPSWELGPYDDSLSAPPAAPFDAALVWLDIDRFADFDEAMAYLRARLGELSSSSGAPFIVALSSSDTARLRSAQELLRASGELLVADVEGLCGDAGVALTDPRTAALSGTAVSRQAQALLARALGTRWIPAAVSPPVKVICVDLDNTLHAGVLGEDGLAGVEVDDEHRALLAVLESMHSRGVLTALITRNDPPDVDEYLRVSALGPRLAACLDYVEASWDDKSAAIARVLRRTRVAADAVVFVDDNAGELAEAVARNPGMHAIRGGSGMTTVRALDSQPGIWRWRSDSVAGLRAADLAANKARASAGAQLSPDQVLATLGTAIEVRVDDPGQLARAADLSARTNQFNLCLARLSEPQVRAAALDPARSVVTVGVRDRLSDSGVVAVLVAERAGAELRVRELCISCRALGRGLEDTIIGAAVRAAAAAGGEALASVRFAAEAGPRNHPALDWLAGVAGGPADQLGSDVRVGLDELLDGMSPAVPVALEPGPGAR